jgi:hypothetical protein
LAVPSDARIIQGRHGLHSVEVGVPLGEHGLHDGNLIDMGLGGVAGAHEPVQAAPTHARHDSHQGDGDQQLDQREAALRIGVVRAKRAVRHAVGWWLVTCHQ